MTFNVINILKGSFKNIEFLKQCITCLLLGFAGYCIQYIVNILVSNNTSPEVYGYFSLTIRSIVFISTILLLGTDEAAKKYLAIYIDAKDSYKIQGYIIWNLNLLKKTFLVCLLTFILLFIIFGYLYVYCLITLESFFFIFFFIASPIVAFFNLLASYFLCNKWSYLTIFFKNVFVYIFILIFFGIATVYIGISIYQEQIFLLVFITFSIASLVGIIIAKKMFKDKYNLKLRLKSGKELFYQKEWFPESMKLAANKFLYFSVGLIPMAIVGTISPSKNALGYYGAILTITGFFWLISTSVTTCLVPVIKPLLMQNKKTELKERTNHIYLFNLVTLFILLLLIIIFSENLLNLFGSTYITARSTLIVQSFAFFIGASLIAYERVLTYTATAMALKINIIVTIILILLGILLTLYFGIFGMALALLINLTIKKIWVIIETNKQLRNY